MVRLTDRPNKTLDVYRGRKTTIQQQQQSSSIDFVELAAESVFSAILWNPDSERYKQVHYPLTYWRYTKGVDTLTL